MPRPPSIAHAVMILLPAFVVLPLVGRFSGVDYDVIADTLVKNAPTRISLIPIL